MSRGFRFRLEAALRQRVRQEQAARQALALAARAHARAEAEIEHLRRLLAAEQQERTAPGTPVDLERRMYLLLHVDRSARDLEGRTLALRRQEEEVRRAGELLRQAAARRRALERLRDRRRDEYNQEEERRMRRELDEQGSIRFSRQTRERGEGDAPVATI